MSMDIRSYEASDGATLRYREWRPEGKERAVVVNLHGIQSHSGWFVESCEHLARNGVRVVSLDRRGSGLNEEDRGHAPSYRLLIDDLVPVVETLRSEGAARVHLLGVCWGGKVAAGFAGLHPERVASLMLSAPGFVAKVRPGLGECLMIGLCSLARPRRLFRIPIDRAEMFTSNPERIEFIKSDPLRLDLATARLMAESKRIDWFLRKIAPRIAAPSLLMLSGNDPIVDNEGTEALFNRFGSSEKRIERFEGACHMLEFEPDKTRYLDTLVDWLKEHS